MYTYIYVHIFKHSYINSHISIHIRYVDWEMSSGAMSRSIEYLHDTHVRASEHLQTSLEATYDFISRQNEEHDLGLNKDDGGVESDSGAQDMDMPLDPDTFSSQLMTLSKDTTRRLKGIFSKVQKEYNDMEEAVTMATQAGTQGG